jgi:predicted ATPase
MSAIQKNFHQIWQQLRSQQASRGHLLEEVVIKGLPGISELRVPFPFPVTVLAGANGCGKSTVLFALACAYKVPNAKLREFTPTTLFPDFRSPSSTTGEASHNNEETPDLFSAATSVSEADLNNTPEDVRGSAEIAFSYITDNNKLQMRWARGQGKWNRSFLGRKDAHQPERKLYLRTLATLSNPSEVRSVLQMAQRGYTTTEVDASNIAFAQRILSFRYSSLRMLTSGLKDVLFAERNSEEQGNATRYSEFHMLAGERAVLRLSISLSKLENALVLIDEVEAGLHPYVQQLLMLELQRLALRNKLQVVVTTHSPVILDTVPPEARVFLERTQDNVVRREPYRDIIQKALYGRSQNLLSVLCEDEEAEFFVRGVLDFLGPQLDFLQNDIQVGRDTGKDQFPSHLETLGRFRKLSDVVFVLDGDGRNIGTTMKARAEQMGQATTILFLPGNDAPEIWVWNLLRREHPRFAPVLGLSPENFATKLVEIDNLYASAADRPSEIAKNKLYTLATETAHTCPEIIRAVARTEAEREAGEIFDLANQLKDAINDWRSLSD